MFFRKGVSMGTRGPKKTPTAILELRGSKREEIAQTCALHAELPAPLVWLDGPALDMWHDLAPMLYHAKVLSKRDRNALARYCRIWHRWRQAGKQVDKLGMSLVKLDKNKRPELQRNPLAIEARTLAALLDRMEAAFGLIRRLARRSDSLTAVWPGLPRWQHTSKANETSHLWQAEALRRCRSLLASPGWTLQP